MGVWERVLKGGYIKDCQRIFRQLRHLAKVAHRGRSGIPCPAVARATPTAAFALLALKGRQITDGGKQRVAPGHGTHNNSPLLGEGQGWGNSSFIIHHSSFIIHHSSLVQGEGGGWPGVTLRSPPSVLCRPVGARRKRVNRWGGAGSSGGLG